MSNDFRAALLDQVESYTAPRLVFSRQALGDNADRLARIAADTGCEFVMPVKAFSHPEAFDILGPRLSGFDVSNPTEMRAICSLAADCTVLITNPAEDFSDLSGYLTSATEPVFQLESAAQLAALDEWLRPVRYCVRLDSNQLLGLAAPSRFGYPVDASEKPAARGVPEVIEEIRAITRSRRHRFVGFHVHHGSERNQPADYVACARAIASLCRRIDIIPEIVDLGGGLHSIGYDGLPQLVAAVRAELPATVKLIFEPGRLLSTGCGFALGKIAVVKRVGSKVLATSDLSRACHLMWSDPGLMYPRGNDRGEPCHLALFGPTCYEDDRIGEYSVPAENPDALVEPGDVFVLGNVSGYSVSWQVSFNGIEPAQVVFA